MRVDPGFIRRVVPCAALALAGCFSLGRDTPPVQHYVLGGSPSAMGTGAAQNAGGLTLGMRRLDLAAYLATSGIVVRHGVHRIVPSQFHRWGEDAAIGINRVVAGYLAAEAAVRAVDVAPWPIRSRHDYLLQLHVSRFEGVAGDEPAAVGEAHVAAAWEISRPQDGTVLARGTADYRQPGWSVGDHAGLVALLDFGLKAVARDIATCLAGVAAAGPQSGDDAPASFAAAALVCGPHSQ